MAQLSRHRLPWSMSETNRLYNEYELKNLPISTIAKLHARSQYAILHKLSHECLINESWNDVKGWDGLKKFQKNVDMQSDDDDDDDDFEEDDHESDSDYTESDDEDLEADNESVISEESLEDCDDPNDSDYVDEEMDDDDDDDSSDYEDDGEDDDDDDDDDENEKEFDPYSIPQKVSSLKKLIESAKFFLYSH